MGCPRCCTFVFLRHAKNHTHKEENGSNIATICVSILVADDLLNEVMLGGERGHSHPKCSPASYAETLMIEIGADPFN